jgi:hypothetical protein
MRISNDKIAGKDARDIPRCGRRREEVCPRGSAIEQAS